VRLVLETKKKTNTRKIKRTEQRSVNPGSFKKMGKYPLNPGKCPVSGTFLIFPGIIRPCKNIRAG